MPEPGTPNVPPPPTQLPQGPDEAEIQAGKAFAILSYALSLVGLPFFVIPMITRDNRFSLYHAKQVAGLWIAGIVLGVVAWITSFFCIGIILAPIFGLVLLVLDIIGLVNAISGQMKPLPLLGEQFDSWFSGLTVKK